MRRAALLFAAVALWACHEGSGLPRGVVTIAGQRVEVEVASTPETRERGLSGRSGLAPDTGLLFLHPKPRPLKYWMREMRFSIDMVWMREGRIVNVSHRVPAPAPGQDGREIVAGSEVPADAVLEVPAGYARAHGFAPGERVTIELFGED